MNAAQRRSTNAALRMLAGHALSEDAQVVISTPCGAHESSTPLERAIRVLGDAIERCGFFSEENATRYRFMENGEAKGAWRTTEQLLEERARSMAASDDTDPRIESRPRSQPNGYYPAHRSAELSEERRLLAELHEACLDAANRSVHCVLGYFGGAVECTVNRGHYHEPANALRSDPGFLGWLRSQIIRIREAQPIAGAAPPTASP